VRNLLFRSGKKVGDMGSFLRTKALDVGKGTTSVVPLSPLKPPALQRLRFALSACDTRAAC
jgi:hypothetical protein